VPRLLSTNDPATVAAEMKISANAVGYQDHPNGDKQCSECVHFLPPSSCKIVEGTIGPHGYCRIFARRRSAAARGRASASKGGIFDIGVDASGVLDSRCSAIKLPLRENSGSASSTWTTVCATA
jgi:hypothetical protein